MSAQRESFLVEIWGLGNRLVNVLVLNDGEALSNAEFDEQYVNTGKTNSLEIED